MPNKKTLTVREGFVFYLLNEKGHKTKEFKAGEKVEIDIESKLFEGQKIKFQEAIDGTLFGEKKSIYKAPVGATSKKTTGTKPPVDANKKAPKVNPTEAKERAEKTTDAGVTGTNPHPKKQKSWYAFELEALEVEFEKDASKADLKKLYDEKQEEIKAEQEKKEAEEKEATEKAKAEEEAKQAGKLVTVSDLEDGTFPTSAESFDFSSADEEFLSAWALSLGLDIDGEASLEILEKEIRGAF